MRFVAVAELPEHADAVAALPVQEAEEPVILIPQEPDAPVPVSVGEYEL